jgi:hypothetical protein
VVRIDTTGFYKVSTASICAKPMVTVVDAELQTSEGSGRIILSATGSTVDYNSLKT